MDIIYGFDPSVSGSSPDEGTNNIERLIMKNTFSTDDIEAIISRTEIIEMIEFGYLDMKSLVLISISEPSDDDRLTDKQVEDFKESLRVEFWDIEDSFPGYPVISDEIAKTIQDFIMKHKDEKFIIHCRAGQSRSAGVGKAVECIKHFGIGEESKYNYQTGFKSGIDRHPRYSPNLTVFDKIVKG